MKKLVLVGVLAACNVFGMNVQNNANDRFGRQMTENLTNLNIQNKQNENILRSQFVAHSQVLQNEIDERDAQIQRMQDQMQRMEARMTQLQDLVEVLKQGNVIAEEANEQKRREIEMMEAEKRRKEQEDQRAQDEINARKAEWARLQSLIDKKNREINLLDMNYIHIPPHKRKTFHGTCNGMGEDYKAFCQHQSNAKRKIPQLRAEVAELIRKQNLYKF